ncbi:MAG TPA: cation diffusion facilitator family transporter [Gemmatimonadaceae bacterium]|nr:cation diffusion facilitator family transporter [Gemmatimonadaceae bacterium]
MTSPAPTARRDDPTRTRAVRDTLLVILALNALVVVAKVAVGWRTGALSVLGAALESTLDMLNNVVGIALVAVAARAPDEDHPYGHAKFETLGALAIVGFLSISCFELLREGVRHLLVGDRPQVPSTTELAVIAATMLVNVFVVRYERRRGRELDSPFLLADAAHTSSDIFVTAAALGSLLLTRLGWGAVDPALAIVVALVIAWNGYEIARGTVPVLVDERALDAADIRREARAVAGVAEVRAARSRKLASGVVSAELTIGVDASMSVAEAHHVMDEVEARLTRQLGASDVHVHVEPV